MITILTRSFADEVETYAPNPFDNEIVPRLDPECASVSVSVKFALSLANRLEAQPS